MSALMNWSHLHKVLCEGAPIYHSILGSPDLGSSHEFHGICDLHGVLHRINTVAGILQPSTYLHRSFSSATKS